MVQPWQHPQTPPGTRAPAGSAVGLPGYVQLYFNCDLNGTFPLPTSPPACFTSRCVDHHPPFLLETVLWGSVVPCE